MEKESLAMTNMDDWTHVVEPDECERIDFNVRSGALSKSLFISNQGKTSSIYHPNLFFLLRQAASKQQK